MMMESDEYTLKNEATALPGGAQGGKTVFWEICRNTGLLCGAAGHLTFAKLPKEAA